MKVYNKFEEIEDKLAEMTPPIIYKYRNWDDGNHKKIITQYQLWFAHPHKLNDPYDVRAPYNFVVSDVDLNEASNKIREAGRAIEPNLSDEELVEEVEKRIRKIEQDPIKYFQDSRMDFVLDSSKYDSLGILSLCSSFENEAMWAHYGNNHCGFALVFNTLKLAKALNCTVGIVDYDDTPLDFHIMGNNDGLLGKELFRKSTKWRIEEEVRFTTPGIGFYRDRTCIFPNDAIEEVVFGLSTKTEVQDEVIEIPKSKNLNIPAYKLTTKIDSYGLAKTGLK